MMLPDQEEEGRRKGRKYGQKLVGVWSCEEKEREKARRMQVGNKKAGRGNGKEGPQVLEGGLNTHGSHLHTQDPLGSSGFCLSLARPDLISGADCRVQQKVQRGHMPACLPACCEGRTVRKSFSRVWYRLGLPVWPKPNMDKRRQTADWGGKGGKVKRLDSNQCSKISETHGLEHSTAAQPGERWVVWVGLGTRSGLGQVR
jgi:hypothetical protein